MLEHAAAALRAGAERLLAAEVDRLVAVGALAEVELDLEFIGELQAG